MRPVLLDAQLLVLLVVGTASRGYIAKHKRLTAYTAADFDLLIESLTQYSDVVVMPNTLTEASNLLNSGLEPMRSAVMRTFGAVIGSCTEIYLESRTVSGGDHFVRLGLTDAALIAAGGENRVLLTADFDLYWSRARAERDAVNFNHYREARGIL